MQGFITQIQFRLFSILATQPTGLNGHPVIEQLCEILASKGEQTPLFTAFLVDRLEEQMRADEAKRAQLLPEAEEVSQATSWALT